MECFFVQGCSGCLRLWRLSPRLITAARLSWPRPRRSVCAISLCARVSSSPPLHLFAADPSVPVHYAKKKTPAVAHLCHIYLVTCRLMLFRSFLRHDLCARRFFPAAMHAVPPAFPFCGEQACTRLPTTTTPCTYIDRSCVSSSGSGDYAHIT